MILESFDQAEADLSERQVREARVESDAVLAATEKARGSEAYHELTEDEKTFLDRAINELLLVYHSDDYHLIREKIDQLDQATQKLAEIIMNDAVGKALKGARVDEV